MTRFPFVHKMNEGVAIDIHVQPRARNTEWVGRHGKRLKLRITAPPVDGKANSAIRAHVAETFGLRKSCVQVIAGHTGRRKRILLQQACLADLKQKLTTILESND